MIEVIQFGEGNFLRAFVDYYFQRAKESGKFNGGIAICQPRNNTKIINALKKQACKYNVLLRGRLNGSVVDESIEIDCVAKAIDTVSEFDELKDIFKSSDLKIVASNTTEAGICFHSDDRIENCPDISFPGKLALLLFERFKNGLSGLTFLPVELIDCNGFYLKECIVKYAALWDFGDDFINYVNEKCHFCNTLVDRIVTGFTEYGNDECAVACEPYGAFIIEADAAAKAVLPFDDISDVKYVDCIRPYRERKVKILNGVHTMTVLLAYNMGFGIVRDMLQDSLISEFIKTALSDEIIPTIELPVSELEEFADAVIERFNNPFIDHKLIDISLNSVSKFKARCLPTIIDYHNKYKSLPSKLCLGLAGLIDFYKNGPANDSDAVLEFISNNDLYSILSNGDLWGIDLTGIDGLYDLVKDLYCKIQTLGVRKTMELVCNE